MLKICDLGTAIDRSDAATASTEITPYLVSRFYRAPEIILGMPYDYAVDMWSIGCTLYELYTGKILFTGDSNNQMLRNIMEIRGKFGPKLYRRGQLSAMHFDELGNFVSVERDKMLGKVSRFFFFFSAFPISHACSRSHRAPYPKQHLCPEDSIIMAILVCASWWEGGVSRSAVDWVTELLSCGAAAPPAASKLARASVPCSQGEVQGSESF